MKHFLLLLLFLTACFATAQEYGGSLSIPSINCYHGSGGAGISVVALGTATTQTIHPSMGEAVKAASNLALRYPGKLVIITPAVIYCSAKYAAAPGTALVQWTHPTERENGQALAISEIAGYEIKDNSGVLRVSSAHTSAPIRYSGQTVEIATIDTNGLYSNWITVTE